MGGVSSKSAREQQASGTQGSESASRPLSGFW
jgi:hypothetical protein